MACGRCVIEGCANKPHVGGNTLAGGTEQSSGKLQLSSALCWIKADMQMEAAALVVMADKGPHLQSSSDHPRLHVPTGHSLQGAMPVLDPKPGMHLRGVREDHNHLPEWLRAIKRARECVMPSAPISHARAGVHDRQCCQHQLDWQ
jgi:hypothetical protein